MALLDIFIGTPQSKYAATAILAAILVVALAILFGKEQLPIGQKFLFILIMFIVALPSILLGLFSLTCTVTGSGYKNKRWWCSAFAWLNTIFIIIYSVIIVIVGIMSLVNGSSVISEMEQITAFEAMQGAANRQAQQFMQSQEGFVDAPKPDMAPKPVPPIKEKFQSEPEVDYNDEMEKKIEKFNDGEKKETFLNEIMGAEPFMQAPSPYGGAEHFAPAGVQPDPMGEAMAHMQKLAAKEGFKTRQPQ